MTYIIITQAVAIVEADNLEQASAIAEEQGRELAEACLDHNLLYHETTTVSVKEKK